MFKFFYVFRLIFIFNFILITKNDFFLIDLVNEKQHWLHFIFTLKMLYGTSAFLTKLWLKSKIAS